MNFWSSVVRRQTKIVWPAFLALAFFLLFLTTDGWRLATAHAQTTDQGGGGSGGGTGGGAVGSSLGQSFGQPLVPGLGGSLLQSGPPQPGGSGLGGNLLPTAQGQTMSDRIAGALGLQPASVPGQPAVQLTPAIAVQQGWTNNVLDTPGIAAQSAFITSITPSIAASVDTGRVQATASYAPSLYQYEPSYGQSTVAQNLSAQAHVTLLPDSLFVNLSAFGGQQTITGGLGPTATVVPNNTNTAQDYGFSLMPYWQHRFGGFGIVEIGGTLSEDAQLIPGSVAVAPLPGLPPVNLYNQTMTSTEEHVIFTSGEDFGRWLSNVDVSTTQYGGTGVFVGAYDNTASYEAGYAITHNIMALATIGWDDLYYNGIPPIHIDQPLWNVGVQLTPNPDSSITLRYGTKDGITAAYVNGVYMPTPRLRINANYSATLSTDPQQLNNALPNASTDANGNLVNAQTGQPLLQNNNFLGMLEGVYRLDSTLLSGTLLYDRDTFQLAFNRQRETPLNTIPGGGAIMGSLLSDYGTLSWSHNISDALQSTLSVQYGVAQSSSGSTSFASTVLIGSFGLNWSISDTLHASLQYSHTDSSFGASLPAFAADLVLVGLSKSF